VSTWFFLGGHDAVKTYRLVVNAYDAVWEVGPAVPVIVTVDVCVLLFDPEPPQLETRTSAPLMRHRAVRLKAFLCLRSPTSTTMPKPTTASNAGERRTVCPGVAIADALPEKVTVEVAAAPLG
jgi:hypothetical protein